MKFSGARSSTSRNAGALPEMSGSNELYRQFALPETVDVGKITATLDKGVLRIEAPKGADVPAKKVVTGAAA